MIKGENLGKQITFRNERIKELSGQVEELTRENQKLRGHLAEVTDQLGLCKASENLRYKNSKHLLDFESTPPTDWVRKDALKPVMEFLSEVCGWSQMPSEIDLQSAEDARATLETLLAEKPPTQGEK